MHDYSFSGLRSHVEITKSVLQRREADECKEQITYQDPTSSQTESQTEVMLTIRYCSLLQDRSTAAVRQAYAEDIRVVLPRDRCFL